MKAPANQPRTFDEGSPFDAPGVVLGVSASMAVTAAVAPHVVTGPLLGTLVMASWLAGNAIAWRARRAAGWPARLVAPYIAATASLLGLHVASSPPARRGAPW